MRERERDTHTHIEKCEHYFKFRVRGRGGALQSSPLWRPSREAEIFEVRGGPTPADYYLQGVGVSIMWILATCTGRNLELLEWQ